VPRNWNNIRLVVLNVCYSKAQTEAIAQIIECAIGMNASIGDEAAILFSAAFYQALGFGRDVQTTSGLGENALALKNIPEEQTPELYHGVMIDPSKGV